MGSEVMQQKLKYSIIPKILYLNRVLKHSIVSVGMLAEMLEIDYQLSRIIIAFETKQMESTVKKEE